MYRLDHVKIKATEARPSHDCTFASVFEGLSNCPQSETSFLFHLLTEVIKKAHYHQPGCIRLTVIWEYLLTGRSSDSRRELMRTEWAVRATLGTCQDRESLGFWSSSQMTVESKRVNTRVTRKSTFRAHRLSSIWVNGCNNLLRQLVSVFLSTLNSFTSTKENLRFNRRKRAQTVSL